MTEENKRRLVIPGETIISGEDYLPGDYTKKKEDKIIANRYGLAEIGNRVVKIIPVSGVYDPRGGNTVIGRIEDITFSGWIVDIGAPYQAFLPINECPRFIERNNLESFAGIGDMVNVKITSVKKGGIDLTLKSRGLRKLEGGRIIKINPHKVPRIIGREGSMINLIKDKTGTKIIVGQNGYIWLQGEDEIKAEEAIKMVSEESTSDGLTEKMEKFLGDKE